MHIDSNFAQFIPEVGKMKKMGEVKKFNVLCISKRQQHGDKYAFHVASPGKVAEVTTVSCTSIISAWIRTVVCFNGDVHELLGIRSGLNGSCVVLSIKLEEPEGPYDIWDLYTDTPNPGPHCPEKVTSESLREHAARLVRA